MFGAFVVFIVLQSVFGWQVHNENLAQFGRPTISYWHYLGTGHFGEAVFENWESEFLQIGSYVLLTAYLVQRGSPESKPISGKNRPSDAPQEATKSSPSPSKRPGFLQLLYRNSLGILFLVLFFGTFVLHVFSGLAEYNEQQDLQSGAPPVSAAQFLRTPDLWFQSMQNWQSEFLSVGALIVLSIVFRQHGSPESKPVTAPHGQTGD
jgi:hypothetical protein